MGSTSVINQHHCQPWTTCSAGQKITQNGTTTTDRQCGACLYGTFTSTINQFRCKPWTDCKLKEGETLAKMATLSNDYECSPPAEKVDSSLMSSAVTAPVALLTVFFIALLT